MQPSLRVIDNPVDRLARTLEALLVVASQPLAVEELAAAADDSAERVETALGLLAERYREGRSGIVLERFRAVLRRRTRFDFDGEVRSLSRVEQAVAFLALLELRKGGEVSLEQAAPFAPIRVARAERSREEVGAWSARSA